MHFVAIVLTAAITIFAVLTQLAPLRTLALCIRGPIVAPRQYNKFGKYEFAEGLKLAKLYLFAVVGVWLLGFILPGTGLGHHSTSGWVGTIFVLILAVVLLVLAGILSRLAARRSNFLITVVGSLVGFLGAVLLVHAAPKTKSFCPSKPRDELRREVRRS